MTHEVILKALEDGKVLTLLSEDDIKPFMSYNAQHDKSFALDTPQNKQKFARKMFTHGFMFAINRLGLGEFTDEEFHRLIESDTR